MWNDAEETLAKQADNAQFGFGDLRILDMEGRDSLGRSAIAPINSLAPKTVPDGKNEPIAIVGMACRFPGADSLAAFWKRLLAGENAVSEGMPGSGEGRVGKLFPEAATQNEAARFGAFVDGIDLFDAEFFRISPVEAQLMDPQQRMMLETCWEALEDAGINPDSLKGSSTGIYVGISNNDYRGLILETSQTSEPAASLYSVSGTSLNVVAGRVSYALGFSGPAMAVDTACSSSLVALHQAVVCLQQGEADLALAGGVQAILSGRLTELRGNAGMLSPDGQCKAFDASANGFVRGEGCGMLVLKRLSAAQAGADRIWGLIRGSAVNQDGASPGLTVPNGSAQEQVIEDALARAEIAAASVDYLEAHGTGTEVGDPIEVKAAATTYGRERDIDRPLLIGSVKTNIGHLEPAAGVAGVIKAVLAMKQKVIPKHLHFRNPNPNIDWKRLPVRVTSETTDWPLNAGRPPRSAVNGFGFSGTNAHVVLEGYDVQQPGASSCSKAKGSHAGPPQPIAVSLPKPIAVMSPAEDRLEPRGIRLLPLSGKSEDAVRDLAERYLVWLDERAKELDAEEESACLLADMAWTAGIGRSHFTHKKSVLFRDAGSLRDGLRAVAEDTSALPRVARKVAFAYTGQASQWVGMGKSLYEREPVVRAVLERCDEALHEDRKGSLLDVMFGQSDSKSELDEPRWKQPAIYALECALDALWSSIGVRPDVVLGHSLGEIAAARAAGVFDLETGLRFAAARGTLIGALPSKGAMAVVFAPASQVATVLDLHNAASQGVGLCIAADNGAHQVVSGPATDIDRLLRNLEQQGVRAVRLRTSPAYHSALVEPALDDLALVLGELSFSPPSVTFVSNLTGRVMEPEQFPDAAYWLRQVREPVAFRSCIETLADLSVDTIVEIGPHAVLGPIASLAWPKAASGPGGNPVTLSSLQRPSSHKPAKSDEDSFMEAVAKAYDAGLPIKFDGLFAGEERRRVPLPSYPFQRERYWLNAPRRRRTGIDHDLLGDRRESARGEITFETEVSPVDPVWLNDHRVFGHRVAPGALYGAMAVLASGCERDGMTTVHDMQLHNPLVFPELDDIEESDAGARRKIQVLLEAPDTRQTRLVQILSKGHDDQDWLLHAECQVPLSSPVRALEQTQRIDPEDLNADLSPIDVPEFYRAKISMGIDLGPSFRTLSTVRSGAGEALGEVALPGDIDEHGLDVHPLLLDGCFQVMAAARGLSGTDNDVTYLPFAWERFSLHRRLPNRLICHVRMKEGSDNASLKQENCDPSEVLQADMTLYDHSGCLLGELIGYTVKRATREALHSAAVGLNELLYEIVWRDQALASVLPASFFPGPQSIALRSEPFSKYLMAEGVQIGQEVGLQADLERLAWSCALASLEKLGWTRQKGDLINPQELRQQLEVRPEHDRLFVRILEVLACSGLLNQEGDRFRVATGTQDSMPEKQGFRRNYEQFATELAALYPHGSNEIGLFRKCAGALPRVLRGQEDPLSLLFGEQGLGAADLYRRAPVWRAANQMLGEVVKTLATYVPSGRRLRVLEVGAGIGSATDCVLPSLPPGSFDYTFTDISAGFFADAEARFTIEDAQIDYRTLDIEKDPVAQGFEPHVYDLVIAANVLHATRCLEETLHNCRELLAPSGLLVALENLRGRNWMDLIFGQLDGWWRFSDQYRPRHALAGPAVWKQVLREAGFEDADVLGIDTELAELPDRGVIVAQGPAEITPPPSLWILCADRSGVSAKLASELEQRGQTVVLVGDQFSQSMDSIERDQRISCRFAETEQRESWRSVLSEVSGDMLLGGIVHLAALDGRGEQADTLRMAQDTKRAAASALSLTQAVADASLIPANGIWFVTRGAQVLERERIGCLSGATLWGLGRVVARELEYLNLRMIDLDSCEPPAMAVLARELLFPNDENQIAYREGYRRVARLVRADDDVSRISLPESLDWTLAPDTGGAIEALKVQSTSVRALEPREVRVQIEARGLNFLDVFQAMGLIGDRSLGEEMCGEILEVGSEVTTVSVGDRVAGLGFGTFGPQVVTREELVARAPPQFSITELATVPTVFTTAVLAFEAGRLKAGDRVLIHAGAGGVGLAAIQLAQSAGAEIFATASSRKQAYLRSLQVRHIFDSRQISFGEEILEATDGGGVDIVVNSLTGPGFIEASLSCLANGGRFVELSQRGNLSKAEMKSLRPDVEYTILELDVLKQSDPQRVGAVLAGVFEKMANGELKPLAHAQWPLTETSAAMECMQAARHIGKIVLTTPVLAGRGLRQDRTYLVTGAFGGIGSVVANWLVDRGAKTIVLNGRRNPDQNAIEMMAALRARGVTVNVEVVDVSDPAGMDAMLARIDANMPPLGGVVHSVGALSDAAIGNQNWERFEQVLWPKVLGAWHLHRATIERDLDLFVLFSSVAGVLGNPGQANHAAANAFLDQLATHRRALGRPGQAIAWGAWSGLGEAEEQRERISERRAASGAGWITPGQGLQALDRLVCQDAATAVVQVVDWSTFADSLEQRMPLIEELLDVATVAEGQDSVSVSSDDLLSKLRVLPAAAREEMLVSFLQREVQAVLRLSQLPELTVGFFDLGMDSLMAVELRNRINRAFSGEYVASNTAVFDYPDIAGLASHLVEELGEVPSVEAAPAQISEPAPTSKPVTQGKSDRIAIVGMACRFPGATDLQEFWHLLRTGRDAVTAGRPDRGAWDRVAGGPSMEGSALAYGGFVEGIDRFDARFFGIPPVAARMTDPQQRMLLETSWQALEDAGMDPHRLRGGRVGVYAGIASSEYRDLMMARGEGSYLSTSGSMAVGRVSFHLGLEGPTMPVMLNCASSLVAVHHAIASLRQGEVDMALVGGVNTVLSPGLAKEMIELGMLSPQGRCKTFDAAADGFVRGEGCGMIVLKRLGEAESDGDRIWGIIRGSAVNQNGASAGPTVPNGPAQERVIEEALLDAGVLPRQVDYLEAHGAGSALGDPIEVRAAASVYGREREAHHPLLMGSVKTNIGHLESAAGVASLIKTILAMDHGVIPRHLNFKDPSPHLNWESLPVCVVEEETDWPVDADRPPRAGVSSFGISGTNAHVVVEGYGIRHGVAEGSPRSVATRIRGDSGSDTDTEQDEHIARDIRFLPLSGNSKAVLHCLAREYLSWLDSRSGQSNADSGANAPWLSDMAWTASIGRSHFSHRAGLVFTDIHSLRKELMAVANGDADRAALPVVRVAFAYAGEAGHTVGMGGALYDSEPVVKAVLDRCDAVIREERNASLLDVMFGRSDAEGRLDDPSWMQPANYALACALTTLWSSIGVHPSMAIGDGLGEIAAAYAAGMFGLEEGLRLASARGRLVGTLPELGVQATALDELKAELEGVAISPLSLSLVNGRTSDPFEPGTVFDKAYWLEQASQSKSRGRIMDSLAAWGINVVVEMCPRPTFRSNTTPSRPAETDDSKHPAREQATALVLASLKSQERGVRETNEIYGYVQAAAQAYEAGTSIDFAGLYSGETRRRISLPVYPFERRRYWFDA